jgi:5-methylcytosine-specific restriction enzyme A
MVWGPTSGRTIPLPDDWESDVRPRILDRDRRRCQWRDEPLGPICGAWANQVDHIGHASDHRDDNLRSLCQPHHARRTSAQGNAARWAHRRRRTREAHPGILPEP